jgi:hypothetical protein
VGSGNTGRGIQVRELTVDPKEEVNHKMFWKVGFKKSVGGFPDIDK